ncbi:RHS repeat-associated core domain-containing protein [Streptococcus sp. HJ1]|uniref:RHS repeat-associated core domain-containing protein n=1 Tax=Streptococcus sp. HJ1 TaxID=3458239 RepID=UPI00403840A4
MYADGRYTYIYTDQDSYKPLAQVHDWTTEDGENRQQTHYFHCDQIGIPREMTDKDGNLLWFGNYTGWDCLEEETKVTDNAYQPFRLQNQYVDHETGLHYNFFRYYEPDAGRFVNQDPIRLWGGENFYQFAFNAKTWFDPLGLLNIQFGSNPNQIYHAFRHTDDLGLDRELVKKAVIADLSKCANQVPNGKPFNQKITVNGIDIQYTEFKLKNGTLNVGRIHGI